MYIGEFQWLDFTNVPGLLDWVAFVLGGLGIGFTIVQLTRSKGALKAAEQALESTRASLVRNQLVAVLPAFEEISREIDGALEADDRKRMAEALHRFSYRAVEVVVLLKSSNAGFEDLANEIANEGSDASEARGKLYGEPTATVDELVGTTASQIRLLAPRISGVAVSIRNDPGKGANA
ncbi:hypothetical protein [Agromyces sp. NPDC055658]